MSSHHSSCSPTTAENFRNPAINSHVPGSQMPQASLTSPSHADHPDNTPVLPPDTQPPGVLGSPAGTADTAAHYETTQSAETDQAVPWILEAGRGGYSPPQEWSPPPENPVNDYRPRQPRPRLLRSAPVPQRSARSGRIVLAGVHPTWSLRPPDPDRLQHAMARWPALGCELWTDDVVPVKYLPYPYPIGRPVIETGDFKATILYSTC